MTTFHMPVSPDVRELLDAIADEMVNQFGITRAEAVARINQQWHRHDLSGENEIILHEDEHYWALAIYFGEVPDWSPAADRSKWTPRSVPSCDSGHWPVAE